MMYIILSMVLIVLLPAHLTRGQEIAVKGGLLFYNLYVNDTLKYNNIEYSFNTGNSIDILIDFKLMNKLSLSTKIGFKTKSGNAKGIILGKTSTGNLVTANKEFSFVNILSGVCFLYAIELAPNINIMPYAGINLDFNIAEKYNITRTSDIYNPDNLYDPSDLNEQYNNSGVTTNIGLRIYLNKVFFEFEYERELYRMYLYEVGSSKSGIIKLIVGYNL